MDLARAKNIDLATATNQVILAMNGQGRALATYGIQIKDGLSGMSALEAVQGAVNGQAQAYADTLSGQLAVAMQSFNKLMSDMGSTQLPILTSLLQWLVKVIDAVDDFTQKHQKLTEVILIFIGVLGALLVVMGSVLVIFGTLAIAVALLGAPFAALIALVVLLAAIIIANWQALSDDMMAIWTVIKSFFTNTWAWLTNLFHTSLTDVQNIWNTAWTGMSNVLQNIWTTIQNIVKTGIDYVITAINGFINALDAIHISLPSISIPGTKLSTPSVNLGFNIPDIPMLAEGGFVTSPTLALIGEAGPEAVVPLSSMGAGGGSFGQPQIVIHIDGGMFLNAQSVRQLTDTIAKTITQQIRVKNYAV
jgi:phage-related minor tail protein